MPPKMLNVEAVYDDSRVPCAIDRYFHCARCLSELTEGRDERGQRITPTSARDYARVGVGMTPSGWQVWCNRHDCNITTIVLRPKGGR
jgi:hypothetical protein